VKYNHAGQGQADNEADTRRTAWGTATEIGQRPQGERCAAAWILSSGERLYCGIPLACLFRLHFFNVGEARKWQ
jgi:hypothetical protein